MMEALAVRRVFDSYPELREDYIFVKEKGGRYRLAPIVGPDKQAIIERIDNTPIGKKVWASVSKNADIHSYRGEYVSRVYHSLARDIKDLKREDIIFCRKDEAGKKLDRDAVTTTSIAIGHNRSGVISEHYQYKL